MADNQLTMLISFRAVRGTLRNWATLAENGASSLGMTGVYRSSCARKAAMSAIVAGVVDPGLSAVVLAKADTGLSEAGYI
jgi:hypothetical protein